jgi:hypothetical protein
LIFIYNPIKQSTGVIRNTALHKSLCSVVKSLPSSKIVQGYDKSYRYHFLRDAALEYDTSIVLSDDDSDSDGSTLDRYDGIELPNSKLNNSAAVSFILEPMIQPVLENDESSIVEKAACDLLMAPLMAYRKNSSKKARNLPTSPEIVFSTLFGTLDTLASTLVISGDIQEAGPNCILIKTGSRYSLQIQMHGIDQAGIKCIVEANTRIKTKSKVAYVSTYKLDVKNKRLKNVVGGLEDKEVDDCEERMEIDNADEPAIIGILSIPLQ